jgi:hypothetical protein
MTHSTLIDQTTTHEYENNDWREGNQSSKISIGYFAEQLHTNYTVDSPNITD